MQYSIEIASVPDRESWVAEIWDGPVMVGEIWRNADGVPNLDVYAKDGQNFSTLNLDSFLSAVAEARAKLGC